MGYSERPRCSSTDTVKLPTNGCDHVTLDLPARKDASEHTPKSRHVWSRWYGLNKEYQKALAALGSSRRRPRPKRGKSQAWGRQLPRAGGGTLAGGAGEPFHGPTEYAGCSRPKPLQSRCQGWATCRELIPEPKFVSVGEICFSTVRDEYPKWSARKHDRANSITSLREAYRRQTPANRAQHVGAPEDIVDDRSTCDAS